MTCINNKCVGQQLLMSASVNTHPIIILDISMWTIEHFFCFRFSLLKAIAFKDLWACPPDPLACRRRRVIRIIAKGWKGGGPAPLYDLSFVWCVFKTTKMLWSFNHHPFKIWAAWLKHCIKYRNASAPPPPLKIIFLCHCIKPSLLFGWLLTYQKCFKSFKQGVSKLANCS